MGTFNLIGVITEEDENVLKNLNFSELDKLKNDEELWLELKKGKLSASEFHRLMGYEDKPDFPQGAETYVIEKVMELVTDGSGSGKKIGSLPAILHGKKYENEANIKFQEATGLVVDFYGSEQKFIQITEYLGLTPDGLIGDDGGCETKCPDSSTHYNYMRNLNAETCKKIYPEVYWQMQGSMFLTKRKYWYFISYDPRYRDEKKRLYFFRMERNEDDINKLDRRIFMGVRSLKKHLEYFYNNN